MDILTKKQRDTLQYTFLLFLIILTTYLVLTTLDISKLPSLVKIIKFKYIFLGLLLIIIYIILESYIIRIILNSIHKTKDKFLGFKLATMGLYYNLITPLESGSQPIQVYALTKSKIPVSKAVAIIVNKTVVFQTIATLYCGLLLFKNYFYLKNEMSSVIILLSTGMIMNTIMLSFGFFIIYSPQKTKYILNILTKLKIFKPLKKKRKSIDKFIDEYYYSVRLFLKDKKAVLKALTYTIIQLTLYFSITYCIYKALGLNKVTYSHLLVLQTFLYMAVSPVPTPGNIGANEIAFFAIFKDVFPKELIGYSVFIYGIFIYYFILLFCGICTIVTHYKMKNMKERKRNFLT